jgi:hypothetical protein
MKKQRIRGKERSVIATRQALMQQVHILTPEEKEELNKQLDELDAMSKEDQVGATLALTAWLQAKWNKYNEPICVNCIKKENCKRQQNVKKCKFFEKVGDENESE